MAAIDDLIAQIDDGALRARLKEEADRLRREQKFGLVFEEHLPELRPVYRAQIRPDNLVLAQSPNLQSSFSPKTNLKIAHAKARRREGFSLPLAQREHGAIVSRQGMNTAYLCVSATLRQIG